MIASPTSRASAHPDRADRLRDALLLGASAAADAVAAWILLNGAPFPRWLDGPMAAIAHGTAVLLLCGLAGERPSRRWLCMAAVLAVPFIGAAVATAVSVTRGRGSLVLERRRNARRPAALTATAMRRLGGALSLWDAVASCDADERRAALSALSRREDPEAIALLRRAAAGRDPDLALSAALVLDEIRERAERRLDRAAPVGLRYAPG